MFDAIYFLRLADALFTLKESKIRYFPLVTNRFINNGKYDLPHTGGDMLHRLNIPICSGWK